MSLRSIDLSKMIDHTNLRPDATDDDIKRLCREAREHGFATVCVNPCWTGLAARLLHGSDVGVTTVIGFPLGATTSDAKAHEAILAQLEGTTEIDMVMNVSHMKMGIEPVVYDEIMVVRQAVLDATLKVIIECCLLEDYEIVRASQIATAAGADFVKTSTGFSTGGATVHDVALIKEAVAGRCKVKAAGGIHTYDEAIAMVEAGADRIGTSSGVAIVTGAPGQ